MELSGVLAQKVRQTLAESVVDKQQEDLQVLRPLLQIQQKRSQIPASNQLLCEVLNDDEGQHLFVYPFAGRKLNEGLAVLLAYRLSQISPNSFSIAMNDYGFELLSTRAFEVSPLQLTNLLSLENLRRDLESTSQVAELAGRQFREIAQICGLVFSGYPGERIKAKSLQISSSLLFTVFSKYDPDNLLYKQAFAEVFRNQLHVEAISAQLSQIQSQQVIIRPITKVSPLCLPILVDRFRLSMSTEELAEKFQDLLD